VKMWSGRFRQPLDAGFECWQRSFPFDQRLLAQELAASRVHAQALHTTGMISGSELKAITEGLAQIVEKAAASPAFLQDDSAEDVHHFVEKTLVELIGETGYKLHSGRSRNEQIATDLRLYVRHAIDQTSGQLSELIGVLLARAEQAGGAAMPAYTHLQRAEPVLVAHWLLAYAEMLFRDLERLADCRKRTNLCPLGSGAVAGATLSLDRRNMAEQLAFQAPTNNSLDATTDRDFVLEFVHTVLLLSLHLSRWAEEMLLFSTQEYGFVVLSEKYSTGSSAMPQKQNPDALELIRGKSARMIGNQVALLTAIKGLPLAYNKDMQETQEPLFEAVATAGHCLKLVAGWIQEVEFNYTRMQEAALSGSLNAWAAATYLAEHGVPFRLAHERVGSAVRLCLEKGCELQELSLEELQQFSPEFEQDIYARLSVESVLALHDVHGGTAPARVKQAIAEAKKKLAAVRKEAHVHA
jgi:argininosuccinate lyase